MATDLLVEESKGEAVPRMNVYFVGEGGSSSYGVIQESAVPWSTNPI